MKTITVRDLRQRWPEAEASLQVEKEMIITRAGKPVAKLVRFEEPPKKRKRFDPVAHAKWMKSLYGDEEPKNRVDRSLAEDREDRDFKPAKK